MTSLNSNTTTTTTSSSTSTTSSSHSSCSSSSSSGLRSRRKHIENESVVSGAFREISEDGAELLERVMSNGAEMVSKSKNVVQSVMDKVLRDWKSIHFTHLPSWMKDNEHLHFGHRPQLPDVSECFKSVFRIHTETGNIWTHLLGFLFMIALTIFFYWKPLCASCHLDIQLSEKLVFLCFFIGAILCLFCSTLFHIMSCHSEFVSSWFSRLDYAGIAILTVGSSIPWIYYGFYCNFYTKLTYIIAVIIMGILTVVLTMWEKFNLPDFRVYRALTFVALGLISGTPCFHHVISNGYSLAVTEASFHWTVITGALYIIGALLYAARIPERFWPGRCDIWFQSHQFFHLLVVAAAFVHYHGIAGMALFRLKNECPSSSSSLPIVY